MFSSGHHSVEMMITFVFVMILVLTAMVVITYGQQLPVLRPERLECNCPETYDPVCARNNRTYASKCFMECAKQLLGYDGPCYRKGDFVRREPPPL